VAPSKRLYLDHNATTPPAPEVVDAVAHTLRLTGDAWGNPSSIHGPGRAARNAVESARKEVARLISALPDEIVFTSGGTESDNLGICGLAWAERLKRAGAKTQREARGYPARVLSSQLEHPAVLAALDRLVEDGFQVDYVPIAPDGGIKAADVQAALRPETVLVSLAFANHELGNLFDIPAFAAAAHKGGALFHCDAVQAVGRLPVSVAELGVDALTLSGHKFRGPKGTGALFVRAGVVPECFIAGGHQERERRGGTENVPGIVGLGVAAQLAQTFLAEPAPIDALREHRDRLQVLLSDIPGSRVHGNLSERTPGTLNMGFEGVRGELLVIGLDLEGVSVSTGAACTSGSIAPSATIVALGLSKDQAGEAVRFSLGSEICNEDIERVASLTSMIVERARAARR